MDELTKVMNNILSYIDKNRWISFSKADAGIKYKAKDKLRAFGLIERHGSTSWQLTKDGYTAVSLGGFEEWQKNISQTSWNKIQSFLMKFW